MNGMPLVLATLAFLALGYRQYHCWIAAKVATLDDRLETPAHRFHDGQNYHPTSRWVLFGHHFAAIAGAGPLVGPVLAAQFGYMPGLLWMLLGSVLAGAVHDYVLLVASLRHDGKSLVEIARTEVSRPAGLAASVAVLFILVISMASLGLVVVNSLAESSWGTFTIAATIPIALAMGLWMTKLRPGRTVEATVFGVVLLTAAVVLGRFIPHSAFAGAFTFRHHSLTVLLALYGFTASVLPVWLLLAPRDYLSSIMKIAVVGALVVGVVVVAPRLHMPAFTPFIHGGGPVIPGSLFPYLFITIACGAISGFHSLVSSGTTPKMLMKESHGRFIGFGAMLTETVVSVLALVAACSLFPMDYFQINVPVEKFAAVAAHLRAMGFADGNLAQLSAEVGEQIAGRTGGAVSLAVGMAQIFSAIPGLRSLMSYWYHFAIMFEALFILTVIDAGTRIARFILQETLGKLHPRLGRTDWLPGALLSSALVVLAWGYFIYTGSIMTLWPLLGTANQMLAAIALAVGTSFLVNRGKARYAWITLVPMAFVAACTLSAGWLNIRTLYWPQLHQAGTALRGGINLVLTAAIMGALVVVVAEALPGWLRAFRGSELRDTTDAPDVAS
jgi:carbon starvation protein